MAFVNPNKRAHDEDLIIVAISRVKIHSKLESGKSFHAYRRNSCKQ